MYVTVEETQKPNKPTEDDLKKAAISIKDIFEDGFEWKDIATLISRRYLYFK
ncbi:MAG: hypothetical protein K1060chlam1_00029 [Candidatus Anoxychlamydiales bacterium]|nr:hypothetical protein [Candidatus Anoxychlamydiales bacterium]